MRVTVPVLATIAFGLAGLVVSAYELGSASLATVALFAAAAIVAEMLDPADELASDPVEERPFTLTVPVQLAATLVAGPWAGAVVAAAGVLSVKRLQSVGWQRIFLRAAVLVLTAIAAGTAFDLAGGQVGSLRLPDDLVPLVALGCGYWGTRWLLVAIAFPWHAPLADPVAVAGETALAILIALFADGNHWNLLALAPVLLLVDRANARLVGLRRDLAGALETFANIVDERDPTTYRHSARVAAYVGEVAEALGLPPGDVARLRWAGRLHDLGKVAVDASVLRKPGRLNDAEWAAVRRAPRLSARLLHRFRFAAQQAKAVEYQHERYDGLGYYGVDGGDLPLASHFLSVADAYDAMTTERAFRGRMTREEALEEIERSSGTQFHPVIAKAFVAVQRGREPASVLTPTELSQLRDAAVPHRLPAVPGARDVRERPELVALLGVVVALVGGGLERFEALAVGAAIAALGLVLYVLGRLRAERLAATVRSLCAAGYNRLALFELLAERLERACRVDWVGLLAWSEHGLGGMIEAEQGTDGPPDAAALQSWLVREAQAADGLVTTSRFEFGRPGIIVALPLRRENSALVGFVVIATTRGLPAYVERALGEVLDPLGLALASQPLATAGAGAPLAAAY
jgi:HD-GYP domain-containing protein (c-di-GMP phosphodiesterase class II)